MTDAEDTVVEIDDTDDNRTGGTDDAGLLDGTDELIERLLAGGDPAPDAPAWCADLALLVQAARAPATPDELADEAALVRAMSVVRLTAVGLERAGRADDPDVGRIVALPTAVSTEVDADDRAPVALDALAGVTDLDAHRRWPGSGRYTAKHAAARLEASRHPMARTLGRALAMKAAAVTTAAVVGVAAAAAATTGIVAGVVVPALEKSERQPTTTTTTERRVRTTTTAGEAREPAADAGREAATCTAPAPCPTEAADATPHGSPTSMPPATTVTTEPTDGTTTSETTTTTVDTPTTTVPATTTSTTSTTTISDPPPGPSPVEQTGAPLSAGPSALGADGGAP